MKTKYTEPESPEFTLKNESARQRWELFHRAIAHAKQTNQAAMLDADADSKDVERPGPTLSVVR